jgi:MFS family permease
VLLHAFHRLIAASAASNLADGALQTVMPLVALSITRDPGAFAAVTLVGRLPWLLVALPAGALNDRLDRRTTMVRVNAVRVAVIGALALVVAMGHQQLWMLYLAAFALGVGETFYDTAAQSIVPSLVPDRRRLERANSRLYAVELTTNQFVGPAVGGLIAGITLTGGLSASAAAYLLATIALLTIVGNYRPVAPASRTRLRTDIAEGVRYLARHPLLRALAICVGVSNLASTAMFAVFPLFAVAPGPMGLTEPQFGLLFVTFGAGSLVGSSLAGGLVARLGRRTVLLLATLVFGLGILVPALTANPLIVATGTFTVGIAVMAWNVTNVSLRQALLPPALMGRVHATHRTIAYVAGLIGAALAGAIGEVAGLRAAFAVGAAITLLGLFGGFVVTDRRIAAAEAVAESLAAP